MVPKSSVIIICTPHSSKLTLMGYVALSVNDLFKKLKRGFASIEFPIASRNHQKDYYGYCSLMKFVWYIQMYLFLTLLVNAGAFCLGVKALN